MNGCKTIYPNRGWLRVIWPTDHAAFISRQCQAAGVHEIPGCKLYTTALDVPYTAWMLPEVRELLESLHARIPIDEVVELPELPRQWGSRVLYDYQLDGVEFILDHLPGVVLADEMGLGKSSTAAVGAAIHARRFRPRPVVIVGPKIVRGVWERELRTLGLIQEPRDFCALESRELNHASFWKGAKWYFVHFEVVKAWWSQIYQERPCVAIIDEAHYVKNSSAQRSNGAQMAMAGSHQRILLSGSPMENRPGDLFNLLTLACGPKTWGYASEFRVRYCGAVSNGYGLTDQGPTHIGELRQRLRSVYLRRTTQEAGVQLPPFTRTSQYCDLGRYRQEYESVVKTIDDFELGALPALVRAIAEGLNEKVLPELTRLRQITSRAKVPATREYVCNALEQDESVVVFTWERESAEQIFEGLGTYPKYLAHGGASQRERDKMIASFQASREPTALITTYGAMAEGVTLHKARIVVNHDLEWILSKMLQAEKRVHRIGQTRKCLSVWMLAEGSMDTLIAPILLRKASLQEEILGIRHDIQDDIGLTELAGREDADALIEQAFAAWSGTRS